VILLTLMLTTDLDEPGYGWNGSPIASGATRLSRRLWTTPDSLDLATDQKAGGSNPSERAQVIPEGAGPVKGMLCPFLRVPGALQACR
jgi:hypothetical protein